MRALGLSVKKSPKSNATNYEVHPETLRGERDHPMAAFGLVPEPTKVHWVPSENLDKLRAILAPDEPRVAAWAFHGKECWAQVIQVWPPLIALTSQEIDPNMVVKARDWSRDKIIEQFHLMNPYGYLIIDG